MSIILITQPLYKTVAREMTAGYRLPDGLRRLSSS